MAIDAFLRLIGTTVAYRLYKHIANRSIVLNSDEGAVVMGHLRCFWLFFVVLIACGVSLGQQPGGMLLKGAERAHFDDLRARGGEALYNLDYEEARRLFNEIRRQFPDHPAGPHSLAATLWLQTMNESRRLQSSLYSTKSFYSKTEDKVDPKTIEAFRTHTREATMLAEARLKSDPRDLEALYFLGATEGLKAAFAGAVERRFMAALRSGLKSVENHRKVLKLDPTYHDAELTIGIYDYVVGGLPLPIKLMASLGGIGGSKKRGIQTLERVVEQGRRVSDDARVMLIAIYKREKRYSESLNLARELAEKYPRNYLFRLEVADALISQAAVNRKAGQAAAANGAENEALTIFDALLRDRSIKAMARSLDLVHYRYGEALLLAGRPEQASQEFFAAASAPEAEPGLASMAYLRAAQSLDLVGKRREALSAYNTVLKRPNAYDTYNEAQRGLRNPYSTKD